MKSVSEGHFIAAYAQVHEPRRTHYFLFLVRVTVLIKSMHSIAIKHQLASNDFDMHLNHSHEPDASEQIFWRSFNSQSLIEYFHTHSSSTNSTRIFNSSPISNA